VPVRFHCPCSIERVERSLLLLGEAELRDIIGTDAAQGFTEVICEFCTTRYELSSARLEELAASISG
jgi:molecular chaperone Hsp33